MLLKLDLANIIYFISVIVGSITGIILLIYSLKGNKSNIPLALSFLMLAASMFFALLINSGLMAEFPTLYRTGNIFALVFIPLPYIYIRCITQNRSLHWMDALHFIPMVVYVVDYAPVLFLPEEEKLKLILAEINNPNRFTEFNQSRFFSTGFHLNFRTLLINFYWVLQIISLNKWQKSLNREQTKFEKDWKVWMVSFMAFQFFLFFPYYLTFFWLDNRLAFMLIHFTGAILLVSSAILLYFYPKLLYGLNEVKYVSDQIPQTVELQKADKISPSHDLKMKQLGDLITKWIDEKKIYLIHGYSIQDFARDTNIPYYQISACINHAMDSTFSDLLNKKRIEYCLELFQKGDFSNYTFEALAKECGFNNRNSFSTAFKKFTGKTPSEYNRSLKI